MKITDEQILSAIFTHSTNREAARAVGLSERRLYDRMRAPSFRSLMNETRRQLLESATGAATARLNDAIATMDEIMEDDNNAAQTRINAADSLIRNAVKLLELTDVSLRLDAIEKQLEEVES